VSSADNPKVSTTTNITLSAGHDGSIVVLDDAKQGISVRFVDDAIGTDLPPAGPVATGGGATAEAAGRASTVSAAAWTVAGLTFAATIALAGAALRRSRT
jgi:hypothetical protein